MTVSFDKIEFESDVEYFVLQNRFLNNKHFSLPIWRKTNEECDEILIMINGFLEGVESDARKRDRHLEKYDIIAKRILKEKNINSILLPLPFHFDRSRDIAGVISINSVDISRFLDLAFKICCVIAIGCID